MKKFIILLVLIVTLGFHSFAGSKPDKHTMVIHGWVSDLFTHNPVSQHWVYYRSYNNNAYPSKDSSFTSAQGHYHIDNIICQNGPLDIEVYTLDCHGNKKSYHVFWYQYYKTLNFTICGTSSSLCKSEWDWSVNPLNSLKVQFNDQSQGNINKWYWDFGDGKTSFQPNPMHTYNAAGTYQAILQVMDTTIFPPCIDSDTQSVTAISLNYYNLAGQVFAGSFPHPDGNATLFYLSSHGFMYLDSCHLNANGVYSFYHVPEGNYLVQISNTSTGNPPINFWPTYYGDDIIWQNSQYLYLQSDFFQGDINLQPLLPLTNGPGKIGGTALQEVMGNPIPAENVEIILADESGKNINFTYTDPYGVFSFPQLLYGTYLIHAEIPGLNIPSVLVTINESHPEFNDITVLTSSAVIGIEETNLTFDAGPVYPNPNKGEANINITSKRQENIILVINDILGIQKINRIFELHSGKNTLELPIDNLTSGTYIVNLMTNDHQVIRKKFELIR